jgi:hypothetical protein
LYVEWHSQYFHESLQKEVREHEARLKSLLGEKCTDWV